MGFGSAFGKLGSSAADFVGSDKGKLAIGVGLGAVGLGGAAYLINKRSKGGSSSKKRPMSRKRAAAIAARKSRTTMATTASSGGVTMHQRTKSKVKNKYYQRANRAASEGRLKQAAKDFRQAKRIK